MTKRDLLRGLAATGLLAEFAAPAPGWVAVGFNARPGLAGTRFGIANPARIEERLALVPDHVRVADRGLRSEIGDASFEREGGTAMLRFSLPYRFHDFSRLRLDPGTPAHVMLAWSYDDDFAHHSAWRRHFDALL